MSDELFRVLEFFVAAKRMVSLKEIHELFGDDAHLVLRLRDMGFVSVKQENPNLLYLLPPEQREDYFVFITSDGLEAFRLEKKARDDRAQEKAERAAERAADRADADENRQKQLRHDWRIAIFNAVTGFVLGAIADHFVDIVGNAIRLWYFLFH